MNLQLPTHCKTFTVLALILFIQLKGSKADSFQKIYTSNANLDLTQTLQCDGRGYFLCGKASDTLNPTISDIVLMKTDNFGAPLWCKTYDAGSSEGASAICHTLDGGMVITSGTNISGIGLPNDLLVMKTDSFGAILWSRAIGGIGVEGVEPIIQTADSGYIIGGTSTTYNPGIFAIYLIKLDQNGNKIWSRVIGDNYSKSIVSMRLTMDEGIIVIGNSGFPYDMFMFKTDSVGIPQWSKYYDGGIEDWSFDIQQTPDSGYIVLGMTRDGDDPTIFKTNSYGVLDWAKIYFSSTGRFFGTHVEVGNDRNYVLTGSIQSLTNNNDLALVKIDSLGNVLWAQSYGGPLYDLEHSSKQLHDGSFIISGLASGFGSTGTYFIKTELDGRTPCNFSEVILDDTVVSLSIDTGISWQTPIDTVWSPVSTVNLIQVNENILCINRTLMQAVNKLPIAAGGFHSLSLCSNGSVRGWGKNQYGQLGDGMNNYVDDIPDSVIGITNIISLYAGERHSLALKNDSTVLSWGGNQAGQLGDGTSTERNTPVNVLGLQQVIAISGGYQHSLALRNDGTVWAWGWNYWGQLGDGGIINRIVPNQVNILSDVVAIAGGNGHSLALKNDGTVWAWGENNSGQLGDSSIVDKHMPVQVSVLNNIVAIAAGYEHSIALRNDSTVWAWGNNVSGQLGDGTNTSQIIPVQVVNLNGVTSVDCGGSFTLALKNDSTVWAFGNNANGDLGDGTYNSRNLPVQMNLLTGITHISAGDGHSLALRSDSTVWACGYNYFGQLGDGTNLFFDAIEVGQVIGLCKVSIPCSISQPSLTNSGNSILCQGDTVVLNSTLANAYLWSTSDTTQSINVFSSGNYFVTITDSTGCSATSDPTTITVNPIQNGLSVLLSNDSLSSPYSQQNSWYILGNSNPIDTGVIHVCLLPGDYYVVGLDSFGCTATSDTIFANCNTTDIISIAEEDGVNIFPNPAYGNPTIVFSILNEKSVSIKLFDITGNLVQTVIEQKLEPGSKSTKVETSKLGNGIYILEIKMGIDVVKRKLVVSN